MCPLDGCFATGCVGQRVIDKQPAACGVDTVSADVGTTYTLTFVVYNTAGLQASVQRVVTVVSPCTSSQYLCSGSCSNVGHQGGGYGLWPRLWPHVLTLLEAEWHYNSYRGTDMGFS